MVNVSKLKPDITFSEIPYKKWRKKWKKWSQQQLIDTLLVLIVSPNIQPMKMNVIIQVPNPILLLTWSPFCILTVQNEQITASIPIFNKKVLNTKTWDFWWGISWRNHEPKNRHINFVSWISIFFQMCDEVNEVRW